MKRLFLLILSFMFLGGAVSSSAFYINSSLNIADTQTSGGDSQSDILENDENLDIYADWQPEMGSGHWSGHYETSFAGGTGIESDPYLISTPGQLAYLSYLVNYFSTNSQYKSLYYEQTADIDLSAYYWDAIGNATNRFSGHYDGGGYTISGLRTESGSSSTYSYQGLFGYVSGNSSSNYAEIHDVGIINSDIQGYEYVGGIVGYIVNYTNIINCYNSSVVNGSGKYVGGIVGCAYSRCVISNCYNIGSINSLNGYVGGIVGHNSSYSEVSKCYNEGNISAQNDMTASAAGGIAGWFSDDSKIYDCYNLGVISGDTAGGITGHNRTDSIISNCYNLGTIYCTEYGGGIAGWLDDTGIYNSFNLGAVITIGEGVNGDGVEAGGIVGRAINITGWGAEYVRRCYWGGNCTLTVGAYYGNNNLQNCTTCNANDPKNLTWYTTTSNWDSYKGEKWDFDTIWTINPSQNNGYPILRSLIQNYEISFNANGGQGNMDSVEVEPNSSVTLPECDFTRTGHEFAGWALSSTGTVVYSDGQTITPTSSMTLYAVWREAVYEISIYWNLRSGGSSTRPPSTPDTSIYYRYGDTFYSDQTCLSPLSATDLVNSQTKAGYSFVSFTTESNGGDVMLQNNQYLNTNLILSDDDWYAHWHANVEAKYDSEGYWYVENGKMPQTKVANSTLISNLNKATTNGGNYYIAGQTLTAKVYSGKEYCKWNNNWYEVEPIRWRLTKDSNQTNGYGTTTDINAVLAEIVFVGQYSNVYLGSGAGYSTTAVEEFKKNGIDEKYLVDYQNEAYNFGNGTTMYNLYKDYTNMFVANESEINSVSTTTAIEFSDLAKDIIKSYGGTNVYFTRDLGSNYNNITCFNEVGVDSQRFATDFRGVQFTIRFTEYACVD